MELAMALAVITGTWCSGITSASHAEGPGFKSQCVHLYLHGSALFHFGVFAFSFHETTCDDVLAMPLAIMAVLL